MGKRFPGACERWTPCRDHEGCMACGRCGLNPTFHSRTTPPPFAADSAHCVPFDWWNEHTGEFVDAANERWVCDSSCAHPSHTAADPAIPDDDNLRSVLADAAGLTDEERAALDEWVEGERRRVQAEFDAWDVRQGEKPGGANNDHPGGES